MKARWISTALLLLAASPLIAQETEPPPLPELGAKVRLTDSGHVVVGTLWALDSTRVGVRAESVRERVFGAQSRELPDDPEVSWALSEVEVLEVNRGSPGGLAAGLLTGALVGGMTLGVVGALTYEPCEGDFLFSGCGGPSSREANTAGLAALGMVLGGLVGGAIGASRGDKWEPVDLPPARPLVAVHPITGRFTVGFSIPLRR